MFINSINSIAKRSILYSTFFYSLIFSSFYASSFSKKNDLDKISFQSYADNRIQGKVVDSNTGQGIPFCNLTIANTYNGTSTNDIGEFIINIKSLPAELIISHISYEDKTIIISDKNLLNINLAPLVTTLEEIVIDTKYNDNASINLARQGIDRMEKLSIKEKFGQAFYRQKSKNDDEYSELVEIIFDTKYNTKGIIDWSILEGRYALKEDKINNKNFTLLSRLMKSLQPNTNDIIFPLRSDFENYYNVKTVEMLTSGKKNISVLQFSPKDTKNKTPIFRGEVYINTINKNILKVEGSIDRDDLKLVKLGKNASKKNYNLAYEIVFKEDNYFDLVIDYISVRHNFNYFKESKYVTEVYAESQLSFFNYYIPTSRKKLGGRFTRNNSDWAKLNTIGYNKPFWENNPIVKRTPVEEDVIASFEKNNAFETIYLNSNNQISLSGSDISNDNVIKDISGKIVNYKDKRIIEKIYLHTNKSSFFKGEVLYYSIYNVLHKNNNKKFSSIIYVDLIDKNNNIITTKAHMLNIGRGSGSILLNDKLVSGNYQIRAYSSWMQNFEEDFIFKKNIEIIEKQTKKVNKNTLSKIDIQFFPEGGNAIVDLNNRIAFKAIGPDGYNRAVSAKIVNSSNETLTIINTLDNGSGYFNLKPKINESYYAVIDDSLKYPINKIKNQGYSMLVDNLNDNSIELTIQASDNLKNSDFYIIGTINNQKYYQGKFNISGQKNITVEIPKRKMPSGVMTITLFNRDKIPLAERPVFINNQQELIIDAKLKKTDIDKRKKLQLDVKVTDIYGNPISTNLSLAITDVNAFKKSKEASNILTYLLLESEIKGFIESPNRFFKDNKRSTKAKLDLVMLTHGWRRIIWDYIDSNSTLKYNFENVYNISGKVKDNYNANLSGVTVKLITESSISKGFYETISNPKGDFVIKDIKELGKTRGVFRGFRNDKAIDIRVELNSIKKQGPTISFKETIGNRPLSFTGQVIERSVAELDYTQNYQLYSQYSILNGISLDEVLLNSKIREKANLYKTPSVYGVKPDATVIVDDSSPTNFLNLLNKISGVRAYGSWSQNGQAFVSIRGKGNPLWVIDGIPQLRPQSGPTYQGSPPVGIPSSVAALNSSDVERLEVLKGAKASVFGARGSDGVILIYTKNTSNTKSAKSFVINDLGLDVSREFYSPNYDVKSEDNKKSDYRTTLYWNPLITTDNKGKAKVEFFNSDIAKELQVSIEGLSNAGLPGVFLKTFGDTKKK